MRLVAAFSGMENAALCHGAEELFNACG